MVTRLNTRCPVHETIEIVIDAGKQSSRRFISVSQGYSLSLSGGLATPPGPARQLSCGRSEARNGGAELWFSQDSYVIDKARLFLIDRLPLGPIFAALIVSFSSWFRSRAALQLEILALRLQMGVLQRSVNGQSSQPLTEHCRRGSVPSGKIGGRRPYCESLHRRWMASEGLSPVLDLENRRGKPGRPVVPKEIRELIRMMSSENPLWGAPKVHGELLKLRVAMAKRV
jgi:hypothetical protein